VMDQDRVGGTDCVTQRCNCLDGLDRRHDPEKYSH
jgi:hypothetical protein